MGMAVTLVVLLVSVLAYTNGDNFSDNCKRCICEVEGCEGQIGQCREDVGSLSCGPYQIKNPYYIDCYSPGDDWQSCTKQMECSEQCVDSYMKRYGEYCTPNPTCKDYARIHNGGPQGCRPNPNPDTEDHLAGYWGKVNACCNAKGGC
jgi:hypothetical protein